MAASVRTLVVSWKEAADRKQSVARDALVMPMRSWVTSALPQGLPVRPDLAGRAPARGHAGVGVVELQHVHHGRR